MRLSSLTRANLLLLGLLFVHTLDHGVGQTARELPGSSSLVGAAGFALTAGSTWIALRRMPIAPEVSTAVGAITAVGVAAVHLMPNWWGWVSDPYWSFDPGFASWLSLLALLAGAVYLTALGMRYGRYRHVRSAYRT
jgi:hypothetical protein